MRVLHDQGIRSVVNLRGHEDAAPLAPADEERLAEEVGLTYVNLPMRAANARPADLDRLRENLVRLPRPVLVHCRDGSRSRALTLAAWAPEMGWNGERVLQEAGRRGIELKDPEVTRLVREYADARRGTSAEPRTAAVSAREPRSGVAPGAEPPRTQTK